MNPFFRITLQQAKKLISNPTRANKLMNKALDKSNSTEAKTPLLKEMKENIILFFQMLRDFFTGKYRKFSPRTAIKLLAALLYFLLFIDLIPDFLAVIGFTDDAAIIAWVLNSISKDVKKYKLWKEERLQTKPLNPKN